MDLLSDILSSARWKGDLLTRRSIFQNWGLRFPCEKSAGFHIVTQGSCFVRLRQTTFELKKGDMLFIAKGSSHDLFSAPGEKILELGQFQKRVDLQKLAEKPLTTFISIRYEVPQEPMHPFLLELPESIFIKGEEVPAHHSLHSLLSLISSEVDAGIGSDLILQKLADILLYQVLRYFMGKNPTRGSGWRKVLADEKMRVVIECLHRKPEHPWTIESLAEEVGMSRASLATRFRQALGTTPMHYLSNLRIDKGRDILRHHSATLEEVARRVGYSSAFAYSKAYKRMRGHSPTLEDQQLQVNKIS